MSAARTVVITGAARGIGRPSPFGRTTRLDGYRVRTVHLYRRSLVRIVRDAFARAFLSGPGPRLNFLPGWEE